MRRTSGLVLLLFSTASGATTVDSLVLRPHLNQPDILFSSAAGELQFVFFPESIELSDGQVVSRGAGSNNASSPVLNDDSIQSGVQTLTFSPDPIRDYLTRFGSFIPVLGGGIQIELDFLTLSIAGAESQAAGFLIGSAILTSDDLSVHPTASVGSIIPIAGNVQLLGGATFGPGLTSSDFSFTLDGQINLAVPEPSTLLLLAFGLGGVALEARRSPGHRRIGHSKPLFASDKRHYVK